MTKKEFNVVEIIEPDKKSEICKNILGDLPAWFGIPEANAEYINGVRAKPFYAAEQDHEYIGLISLLEHNEYSWEIYLIGVGHKFRNKGVGTMLLEYSISTLRNQQKVYLTVKTLADSHPSREYAETRQFYLARGFIPLQVFPELWDVSNPCLFMVRKL